MEIRNVSFQDPKASVERIELLHKVVMKTSQKKYETVLLWQGVDVKRCSLLLQLWKKSKIGYRTFHKIKYEWLSR